jgi:UDP-3-O-[3-hydroxymyristoyl] glucosamine N-acyltransferase
MVYQTRMKHTAYLLNKFIHIFLGARQAKAALTAKPDAANAATAMDTSVFTIPTALFAAAEHLLYRFFILRDVTSNMKLLE